MVVEYGEFQAAMSKVELQFERSDADMWSLVQLTASDRMARAVPSRFNGS